MSRARGRAKQTRHALAPQLMAYSALGRQKRWLPYLMFTHPSDFRSDVVNTDRYGFRWTVLGDGSMASIEHPPKEERCGVLVGGSTAFGVGATSDACTVPSVLSRLTGRPWLNLAGRAYSSTQELFSFMLYADAIPPVSQIVLMTGVNDLFMQYGSNRFEPHVGACLYSDLYVEAMDKARRPLLKRLREGLGRGRPPQQARSFEATMAEREGRRGEVLAVLKRNLEHWAALAASRSARVLFALQPTFPWMGKQAASAERELFEARETQDPRYERMIETALSQANRQWYTAALELVCGGLGIGFLDLNEAMRRSTKPDDWLFVDRAHLTDAGYAVCAEQLAAALE